ncbi:hypothetical protein FOCC_FOCC003305 [Frankliniella occidentalis]|nr:hypothetical protein FOCC_FOCC003305 [Frankliniella occidentalis]
MPHPFLHSTPLALPGLFRSRPDKQVPFGIRRERAPQKNYDTNDLDKEALLRRCTGGSGVCRLHFPQNGIIRHGSICDLEAAALQRDEEATRVSAQDRAKDK